ncbi:MAG: 6-bladed beta-propeller [Gemmatimonadota bacterium]|nr:6-bladed beta-propeller [Gemmatimonadota bacterium]
MSRKLFGSRRILPYVLSLVLGSCNASPGQDERTTGVILTSSDSIWPEVVEMPLETPERVYPSDVASGVQLSRVTEARLLSDEGIVLVDRDRSQLIMYDSVGQVQHVLGGPGAGPGEFRLLSSLSVLPSDTVVVYDSSNRRITRFSPPYYEASTQPLPDGLFGTTPVSVWQLPDGSWMTYESDLDAYEVLARSPEADLVGTKAVLLRAAPETYETDTLVADLIGSEGIRVGNMFLTPAFGRSTDIDVLGHTVAIAMPDGFEVRVFDGARLRHIASMPDAQSPLSRAEVRDLRDSTRAAAAEAGQAFIGRPMFTPELQPEMRPSFAHIVTSKAGRSLLREFAPPGRRAESWWLLQPNGRFEGKLRLPVDATVLEVGPSHLLALRRDSLDIPRVELHKVAWDSLAFATPGSGMGN